MKEEIINQVIELANENSNKHLTREEIVRIIEETEKELGIELSGYGKNDRPFSQFYSEEILNKKYENSDRMAMRVIKECEKNTGKEAYKIGDVTIYFDDLKTGIIRTAEKFKSQGLKHGDTIVMCTLSTPETIYSFFAANLIGVKVRPLEPMTPEEIIVSEIQKHNAKFYITNDFDFLKQKDIIKKTNVQKVLALPVDYSLVKLDSKEKIFLSLISKLSRSAISIGKKNGWVTWDKFSKSKVKHETLDELVAPFDKDEIAAILSTSGTNGHSRGVMLTDSNFILSVEGQMNSEFNVDDNESMYNPMPSYSSYFWQDILLAIMYGVRTKLDPLFNPDDCINLIFGSDSSIVLLGPILIEKLNDYIEENGYEEVKKHLHAKHIISGGDILDITTERKFNENFKEDGMVVENALGMSEKVGPAFNPNGILKNPRAYSEGSVGVALPYTHYGIFKYDKENDFRDVNAPGYEDGLLYYQIGEICFRIDDPNLFKGYYNDPDSNNSVFLKHNDGYIWYHTGDIGYMDPAGFQYCTGRKSGLIVRSGKKVWAPKIVNIYQNISGVKDCAVIGVHDENEKEVPALFISYEDNLSDEQKENVKMAAEEQIRNFLNEFHIPSYIWEVPFIPRSLMMKAKIGELKNMHEEFLQKPDNTFGYVARKS